MRKLFLILMTLMACTWGIQAQTRTIHGTILDAADNEPLIGATIMPIGGGQGAAADIDGNFTINVPASVKKANVSYVGYTSKTVDLHDGMKVYLSSSSTSLDDVVVVAYGTASKESLSGSVAVVGAKDIEDRPIISVTSALEGNAPGVQVNSSVGNPGSSPEIRIRGFNTVNGKDASPLYVVDGVPYTGSVADLNPADIESMSVLKDAASCALYGNRGANGVILITTKRAKNVGKVDVNLQVRQGMYNRGLPFYDRVGVNDWMQLQFDSQVNGLMSKGSFVGERADAIESTRIGFFQDPKQNNIYGKEASELFDENGRWTGASPLAGYTDLDWWPVLSQSGYRQEYNLNASAATDKYNIFASIGYLKSNGYMLMTDFERFNGRINANFQPVSYLRFGVNLAATAQESNQNGAGDGDGMVNNPFASQYYAPTYPYYEHDDNGDIVYVNGQPVWNNAQYLQSTNVAQALRLDRSNGSATVVDATAYGTAIIPYGFELTVRGSMHRDKSIFSYYTNNVTGAGMAYNGSYRSSTGDYRSHTFMQMLEWSHDYGDHHVDVLLDHENYYYKTDTYSLTKTGQVFENSFYFDNFENYYSSNQQIGEVASESYLGRARYNYNQKYFGEASIRRDGTSYFSKKHRWGTFWSVGASWIISKEKFLQDLTWINYLKLRAAYGSVGNDKAAGAYSYYNLYGTVLYGGQNVFIPMTIASDNIKWEATKTFDLALEGSLFNDRFNFTIGYFNKRNTDLLFPVTLPASVGTIGNSGSNPQVLSNIGTMQNIGWELQFGVDIIRNRELKWSASLDATFLKNKLIKLPNGRDIPGQSLFQGKSVYEKYTYEWAGVDQMTGQSLYVMNPSSPDFWVYDSAGRVDAAATQAAYDAKVQEAINEGAYVNINGVDYTTQTSYAGRKTFGSAIPTVFGSFGTTLSWKGINIGLLFTYSLGGKIYDSNYQALMSYGSAPAALHKDALNAWTSIPEGMTYDSPNRIDPNGVPQANVETSQNSNANSNRFLTDASYLTLKNINLSYDLPQKWVSALKLQNINIGVSIDDVFIATKRKGMCPGSFNGTQSISYIPARVFSFQLAARF